MSRRSGRIEATKDGPRVVVQQVQQVELPTPEPIDSPELPPEGPQSASKPELKTRLRPNRSSWRQRFSPPPPSKTKTKRDDVRVKEEPPGEETDDATEEFPDDPEPELVIPDQHLSDSAQVISVAEEIQHVIEEAEEQHEEEEEDESAVEQVVEHMEATETTEQVLEIVQEETASETERICSVVHHDALIQQFGLNLVNMSTQPHSRATILAVSQRMIELVRLLRAAQGMDSNIESLVSLFDVEQWPLIIEAIKYVSGYEDGAAKNPQYIFDIGQALRFCAYMLKREAQENENAEFEQQAQQFFNSIESNMSTLVTQQPMEVETVVASTPTEAAVAEIVSEEPNQYRVVLGTSSGDSQPVTLSLQMGENMTMPGTVQVVKIISTPSGKKGIIIPTRILSKKV